MILPTELGELIEALRGEVTDLRRENEALRVENAELRRRLNRDSSTSSKPPSSDGLRKKPRVLKSLRTRTGQAERRAEGPQGRHAAPGGRSGPDRSA